MSKHEVRLTAAGTRPASEAAAPVRRDCHAADPAPIWFVLDAVETMDLLEFYAAYRTDGHGRAAHAPAMMVALLLYSYSCGERSARVIERRCREDVPTRAICSNRVPDHTTIARFRVRHEQALARLFTQILGPVRPRGIGVGRGGGVGWHGDQR